MTLIDPTQAFDGHPPLPDDLDEVGRQVFTDLYREAKFLRGLPGPAQVALAITAARSSQGERIAREWARQCQRTGDAKGFMENTKLAQSETRSLSTALSGLCLTGDRRRASLTKQRLHAIDAGLVHDEWSDL